MKWLAIVLTLLLCGVASALPTTGAATGVNSNGFNVSVTGVTGTDCWVTWGDLPDKENWVTPNGTATAGSASIQVIGTPIFGGEIVYYKACDLSGCGNEQTVTITVVTPVPQTTYGILMKNITNSRFDPKVIILSLGSGYTSNAPFVVIIGIALFFYMIGSWMRTRSVRLISIVGVLLAPFVMLGSSGLYLGIPSVGVMLAKGLLAAALAGVMFSFMRK
jgi:hypothetical protein